MSGGYFDYQQFQIHDIAQRLKEVITSCNDIDELGDRIGTHYHDNTIQRFKEGYKYLRIAEIYAHRIDWLLSADDGEESFHKRLEADLSALDKELGDETN